MRFCELALNRYNEINKRTHPDGRRPFFYVQVTGLPWILRTVFAGSEVNNTAICNLSLEIRGYILNWVIGQWC